jgi:hypothetical protein
LVSTDVISINANISSIADLDICYYNLNKTTGEEVLEKGNTYLNCSDFTDNHVLSGEGSYKLTIFANQSGGISSIKTQSFSYSEPPPSGGGGGGGGTVIIGGDAGWTMEVADGIASYTKSIPKGTQEDLTINFENIGDSSRELTLSCQDIKRDMCKYVTFPEETFTLPLIKDQKLTKIFTITIPDEIQTGEYQFNIVATDDLDRTGSITVNVATGNQGFLLTTFSKLPRKTISGIPYALIFIPELLILAIIISNIIGKKSKLNILWGFSLSLILSLVTVYFI